MSKEISKEIITSVKTTGEFSSLINSNTEEMNKRIERNIKRTEQQQYIGRSKDTLICDTPSEVPCTLTSNNHEFEISDDVKKELSLAKKN